MKEGSDKVGNFAGADPAERARLELALDEQLRRVQDEEKSYQIAKDLSDNLTISYNTSEVVMARLQTTNAKERIYAQSITFFSTNDTVLTGLKACCVAADDSGCEAYTAIAWGVGSSRERLGANAAESVERRAGAKGNAHQQSMHWTQR